MCPASKQRLLQTRSAATLRLILGQESDTSISTFAGDIRFDVVQPSHGRDQWNYLRVPRQGSPAAALLDLPGVPVDWINTRLPAGNGALRETLRPLLEVPRMSTLAIGALLNACVRGMSSGTAFVNVGVWNGFTLLSGMAGNPGRRCVGIDDFSQFRGPRDSFLARFESARSASHRFHEMDYSEYFSSVHEGPIGLYMYDGQHSYDQQRRGLEVAEPFFADGCLLIVDDTNWGPPRRATLDFARDSAHDYRVLLDATTESNHHPTFWNGVMLLELRGRSAAAEGRPTPIEVGPGPRRRGREDALRSGADPLERYLADGRASAPLVTIVVAVASDPDAVAGTVESALAQTWPALEVLVADDSGDPRLAGTLAAFGDRVATVAPDGNGPATAAALSRSAGEFVALVESGSRLAETAVHLALGFPAQTSFAAGHLGDALRERFERALLAGDGIAAAVRPGDQYVLAATRPKPPETVRSRRALSLIAHPDEAAALDDAAAVEAVEAHRRRGATHAAFLWPTFEWLADRPGLETYLLENAQRAVANEHLLLFSLNR